jgi:outer membrane receptor for ferrienterochelin and colicins
MYPLKGRSKMKKSLLVLAILGTLFGGIGVDVLAQEERAEEELLFMHISVVTASKTEEKLSDAPGVITVVTEDELERFAGTTLKDILERVPGLIGSTVYMTDRSMIAVRGAQTKANSVHVLLLINGRPVREVLEGGIITETLESFPVNIIKKIEVIRGPGSVLYGSGAFSAVINVITEKAEKNGVTITGLAGESGAYNTLLEAKYKQGEFSMVVAGRYQERPDWKTTWDYADFITNTVVSKKVDIPNKGPGVYLELNYKNLRCMSSYNQWQNFFCIPDYAPIFPAFGNAYWKKGFADLGYGLEVNEKWNMDINLTYTRSTFKVNAWPDVKRDSYEFIAECANFINPTEKLGIVLGGLYNYIEGKELMNVPGGQIPINDHNRTSFGFYTQADYWLRQNTRSIGGFQVNKVENIDLDIVPRVGLILYPSSHINIKALYSQAFRAPSINEIGLNHPAMKGNPDLKSEKVNTIDVGANYYGEQFQCGVNYFFSKQIEVIFQDRSGEFPLPTYNNIGEIEIQGVEFEGKYYVNKSLFLTGSTLYQKNEDKEGNEDVTPIANFGAKAGISYRPKKGVALGLFNIYQGPLDEKFDTQLNPSPQAYNIMNLHCRLNLNRLLDWNLSQDLSLLLQADNLLDKEIWLPNWGLIIGNSVPVNQGRTIYFGMEVSL